jgi:DNA repair exonuclease SbcCD nuclease subunit
MSALLLFVGDLHLGRSPTALGRFGLDPGELGPARAWSRCVEAALREGVQAVLLAGDLVDEARDRFEAFGHLEQGVERLLEAGVQVLGVAGNHDSLVLPRLARRIRGFHLLGAGGRWELRRIEGDPPTQILGWSMPAAHHRESPLDAPGLEEALAARDPAVACLGLLHADLDVPRSPYAPLSRAALAALPLDACFLGHVHKPDPLEGPRPLGYLGSLVGLDRDETGIHGPCLVRVEGPGRVQARRLRVATLRWEKSDLEVGAIPDDEDAVETLHESMRALARALSDEEPEILGLSMRLVGGAPARRRLGAFLEAEEAQALSFALGRGTCVIVSLEDGTRPAVDLIALARESSPPGRLALLILGLDEPGEPDPAHDALLAVTRRASAAFESGRWRVDDLAAPLAPTETLLRRAAWRLLEALLDQRAPGGG